VKRAEDVVAFLRSRPGKVRVLGSGSRTHTLRAAGDAARLDLSAMDRIVRLDAGDQTCTVESGVRREALDEAVAAHGLELPCLGGGTLGGLFASDPLGPAANGAQCPRSLLLGVQAVLADGTPFRSGARVVKSVAGFDVHKLLVGSEGRLYVATELHLRLKPRPRAEQWFCNDELDAARALALVRALRDEALPPAALQLRRGRDGAFAVVGRITGRASTVAGCVRRHELRGCDAPDAADWHVRANDGEELVAGLSLPSALPKVLAALPEDAPFCWLEGGRFEASLANTTASDALFARLPADAATANVVVGADERRGVGAPADEGQRRLAAGIKQTLDPDDVLV